MAKAADANINLESMFAKMASKGMEDQTGFKVPTSMAAAKDFIVGGGLYKTSEIMAPKVGRFAEKVAQNFGRNEQESAAIGRIANSGWRSGVLFVPTIYKAYNRYKDSIGDYLNAGSQFSNTLKSQNKSANFFNAVNSDLEVIVNYRNHKVGKVSNSSKLMLIDAVATLPAQLGTRIDQVINDIKAVDSAERTKGKSRKKSNKSTEISRKAAEKLNEGFEKGLKYLEVGETKNGEKQYNAFANIAASTFTSIDDLDDLNDTIGRVQFLQNLKDKYFGTVSAGFSTTISGMISSKLDIKNDKELNKINAASMIDALTKHLKKNPSATELSLIGCHKKGCSLDEYIVDIFAQHQIDSGRAEVPRRMQGRLFDAAQQIAEAIADPNRQMHPEALVLLVDKKHGIASFEKGEMTEVKHGQELDAHLAKLQQKPNMSRRRKQAVEKQYKHTQATPEHFKQSWDNLTPDEKFMWSSFLTDEVMADVGVSKEELTQFRHQANEHWQETMEEFLGVMSQLSASELKAAGLNSPQVSQIAEAIKGGSQRKGNYLQKNRHDMTELVADTATLMDAGQPGFIKEILGRSKERRNHKDIIKEKQKDRPLAEQVASRRDADAENFRR